MESLIQKKIGGASPNNDIDLPENLSNEDRAQFISSTLQPFNGENLSMIKAMEIKLATLMYQWTRDKNAPYVQIGAQAQT